MARLRGNPYSGPRFSCPDEGDERNFGRRRDQRGLRRDAVTWYAYLLLGYFTYLVSLQGNIIPFLKADLGLSYGAVALHTSAIAIGVVIVGLFGDRLIPPFGRRRLFTFAALGSATGAILLCLAPAAWASVSACLVIGLTGAFIPAMVSAVLSDLHGRRRDLAYAEANAICYAFAIVAPLVAALAAAMAWNWRLGLLVGAAAGFAITLRFIRTPVPEAATSNASDDARLPPAYWAYWAMLGFGVSLEFAALLWAPAYLQKVVGLSAPAAAIGAGVFFAAMLIGRTAGVRLFALFSLRALFFGSAIVILAGFLAYWLGGVPAVDIAGLFVIGLGTANLFPIIISFMMEAAGIASSLGSTRSMVAPGLALLLTPPLLGSIADRAGLHAAQVMIPVFVALAALAFLTAKALEKRTA